MNIQDYSGDPQEVLTEAFASAKLSPKKKPNAELALRIVSGTVETRFLQAVALELQEVLHDAKAGYEVINGEWSENFASEGEKADYESGMDDVVEATFEPYVAYLSADWMGRFTIDTTVHVENGVENLALAAAKEMYKQACHDKTPMQVLSNAGITKNAVDAALAAHMASEPQTVPAEGLSAVIEKIRVTHGMDFDQLDMFDALETVIGEDDEILAGSAMTYLGLDADDVNALQMAALDLEDAATAIMVMVEGTEPAKPARVRKPKDPAAPAPDAVSQSVLVALKENGAGDTTTAEALGISRSTYTNYVNGKSSFAASGEQYAYLREQIVTRANNLLDALADLDGTEAQLVA